MIIVVDNTKYEPFYGPNPFIVMGEWIVGVKPWAPNKPGMLEKLREALEYWREEPEEWCVESSDGKREYIVRYAHGSWSCTCKGFYWHGDCGHIKKCK